MRRDRERLLDIIEAIERIERYAVRGRGEFEQDELIQTWIVHHLGIMGEAAAGVSEEFRSSKPEVPWAQITGMRNILVHEYFGIDRETVWATVEGDIPRLKDQVGALLSELDE